MDAVTTLDWRKGAIVSEQLDGATALLAQDPLPADAFEQLDALDRAAPADETEQFGDLWEAFYAAGGIDPPQEES